MKRVLNKLSTFLPYKYQLILQCFIDRRFNYKIGKYRTLSQAGQDYWIINEVFNKKKEGYFVDIGAADGVNISNTYILEKKYGWNGVCVEANPEFYKKLTINRNVPCINICVGEKEEEVEFIISGLDGGIKNLLSNSHIKKNSTKSQTRKMISKPLEAILKDVNAPSVIDYLSIDIEGAEYYALKNFPFHKYTFRAITIERPNKLLQELLALKGYVVVKRIPDLDFFYVHSSFMSSFKKNIFDFYWIDRKS